MRMSWISEFMEQEAEDHLTEREALLLGVEAGGDSKVLAIDYGIRTGSRRRA
jgi:hypothetical protein